MLTLFSTEQFIQESITTNKKIDSEVFNKICSAISELEEYISNKNNMDSISESYMRINAIQTLTNLLDEQIKITDKINLTFIS